VPLRRDYVLTTNVDSGARNLMPGTMGRPEKTIIDDMLRQNWSTLHSLSIALARHSAQGAEERNYFQMPVMTGALPSPDSL
jgi:hypothetical protein